jgi:hypothetical protein
MISKKLFDVIAIDRGSPDEAINVTQGSCSPESAKQRWSA